LPRPRTKTTYQRKDGTKVTRPATRRTWGRVKKLPSGRYRASYTYQGTEYAAPETFAAKIDADAWLSARRAAITEGTWTPASGHEKHRRQAARATTLADFAKPWLADRELKPRTRHDYQRLLDRFIIPELGDVPLTELTPNLIASWHARLCPDRPSQRANTYTLLRAILAEAERRELIDRNPCKVRGGATKKRVHKINLATASELVAAYENMPPHLAAMVPLGAWNGLRSGEIRELRRRDIELIDATTAVIHVRRAVTHVPGETVIGPPKSAAGIRDIHVPAHVVPILRQHLAEHVKPSPDALLFPSASGRTLPESQLWKYWDRARQAAGRPDLRFHDLRHTALTEAARAGATLAELKAIAGHSTSAAAERYQHATRDRLDQLANRIAQQASGAGE